MDDSTDGRLIHSIPFFHFLNFLYDYETNARKLKVNLVDCRCPFQLLNFDRKKMRDEDYECCICGNAGPFSNRQRNRAMMGDPAKCQTCAQLPYQQEKEDPSTRRKSNEENEKEIQQPIVETGPNTAFHHSQHNTEKAPNCNLHEPISKRSKKKRKKMKKQKQSKKPKRDLESSDGVSVNNAESDGNSSTNQKGEEEEEDGDDNDNNMDDNRMGEETPLSVSLNDLKQQILGRPMRTGDDDDKDDCEENLERRLQEAETTPTGESDKKSIANSLQRDLSCAICHEPFYQPISLPCGHTCCQECLDWWFDHHTQRQPKCPTCRQGLSCSRTSLKVNTALRACVMALFGEDLITRIQAKRKAASGEMGGAHERGYEVLSPLEDEPWRSLNVSGSNKSGDCVKVRRSIVLDAQDQRMQLALAVYDRPRKITDGSGFGVDICLLTMEEDEATADGFPIAICNAEDEHLIATRESRFQVSSALEVCISVDSGGTIPLARLNLSQVDANGAVSFTLNQENAPNHYHEASSLLFLHDETGAALEIDLALLRTVAGGVKFVPIESREQQAERKQGYIYDQDDLEEEEDEEEFEEDSFVVRDDYMSDVEGNFSDEEDDVDGDDFCSICRDGGELMICDGGDEVKGCGKGFHLACVGRSKIPDGDWICSNCANACGFNVGVEGHEFSVPNHDSDLSADKEGREISNDDKRRLSDDFESSSDDEELERLEESDDEELPKNNVKQAVKRRVFEDSDDD